MSVDQRIVKFFEDELHLIDPSYQVKPLSTELMIGASEFLAAKEGYALLGKNNLVLVILEINPLPDKLVQKSNGTFTPVVTTTYLSPAVKTFSFEPEELSRFGVVLKIMSWFGQVIEQLEEGI